ncbi:MAG: GTPase HflX [Clostridium sp.]|nr:GTPase HflX [Clostridium sp.]
MRKALLVGVELHTDDNFEMAMAELASLAEACGKEPVGVVTQALDAVNKPYYIGPGKVAEVRERAETLGAEEVIFDNTLSPLQIRNLQKEIGLPVGDRTALILDIFRDRARSKEAMLQVEAASLQYMLPRLAGLHDELGRQGGTTGGMSNRGAGEKKIELDKRRMEHRLTELKRELKEVEKQRGTQRKKRAQSGIPRVALVGYTNAGKSTLLNALVEYGGQGDDKKVGEQDMLFATLDTTVRQIAIEGCHTMLLSDTVGFISRLPHQLIEAFHSTLEEALYADLLIQVVDCSDAHHREHIEVTNATLKQLGAANIPMIYVYNKADKAEEKPPKLPQITGNRIMMSASERIGLRELSTLIEEQLAARYRECEMLIPYPESALVPYFQQQGSVKALAYEEGGTRLRLVCPVKDYQKYEKYVAM